MKDLIIIGAGDFGREVTWAVERLNRITPTWNLLGFVDDGQFAPNEMVDGYPVLGNTDWLTRYPGEVFITCSIGAGAVRKKVVERALANPRVRLGTIIDPDAIIGRNAVVEDGCVVCAGTILTINAHLGRSCIVNLNCTVGHDTVLEEFCTVHPGSNLSGKVRIGRCTDIGTGTKIIQGHSVCAGAIVGAGSVIVRDIEEPGTYVGVPVRKIK